MRDLINAILCVLRSGCPWRMVPDSVAPSTTAVTYATRYRPECPKRVDSGGSIAV
jgi:transposase